MKKYNKLAPFMIVLMIVIVLTLGSQRAGAQCPLVFDSNWQIGIAINLSPEAWQAAEELLADYEEEAGLTEPLTLVNARVFFREGHSYRGFDENIIGNGQRLQMGLGLLVEDPRAKPYLNLPYPGIPKYTWIYLKGFTNSAAVIDYSIGQGWTVPPSGMEGKDLKSDIVRTHRVQRQVELVHGGELFEQVDRVEYSMKAEGPLGKVQLQTSYLKRNEPFFTPAEECGAQFPFVLQLGWYDDPTLLHDFSQRATTFKIRNLASGTGEVIWDDLINLNLKFDLEDELLDRIFGDKNNTIAGVDEQFRDTYLTPYTPPPPQP